MNVLAITYGKNFFEEGNSERQRMQACAAAAGSLHAVVFTDARDGFSQTQIDEHFTVYPTNARTPWGKLWRAIVIARQVMATDPQGEWVITAQDPFEAGLVGYIVARLSGAPLNLQEHGDFFSTSHWRQESLLNRLRAWWGIRLLRRATTIRVVSARIQRTVQKNGIAKDRILTLPVMTDTRKFVSAAPNPALIPDYSKDNRYLLTVARFVPQKNLSLLIQAFGSVATQFPHARLLIVGRGPQAHELKRMAAALAPEQILFLPWSEDVPALMATADIYTLSSNYEGWGRVLVEAQAAGMQIVTTDVGCVGEAVVAGELVRVVPVGDQAAYTAALSDILTQASRLTRASQHPPTTETTAAYAATWVRVLRDTQTRAYNSSK